jgi:tetrahydromethanopterin S-methyltransferase subunit G
MDQVEVESDVVNVQDAFESGFSDVREEPAEEIEADEVEEQKEDAGYSPEQIQEFIAKAARVDDLEKQMESTTQKLYGKFGEVQRDIQSLRAKDEPAPEPKKLVTAGHLKRVSEELGDELAEALANDLNELQIGRNQEDSQQASVVREEEILGLKQEFEEKLLTNSNPDWRDVVGSDGFGKWKASLRPEVTQELDASWDANYISKAINAFKSQTTKKSDKRKDNQRRLESATQAQGVQGDSASEDDINAAYLAGIKNVRG